jgi:hypothetical protein
VHVRVTIAEMVAADPLGSGRGVEVGTGHDRAQDDIWPVAVAISAVESRQPSRTTTIRAWMLALFW